MGAGVIRLWNLYEDNKYSVLDSMPANVYSSELSPDGKYKVMRSPKGDRAIVYANSSKKYKDRYKLYGYLEESQDSFSRYSWSPDGKYLIGSSSEGKFGLWNAKSGLFIQTFEGHNTYVDSVGFTSDGRKIISKDRDGKILQWDFPPLDELIEKTKAWAGK